MARITTSISLDADVKAEGTSILNELGLDLSTAVGMFLKQTIRERKLPFSPSLNVPNATTRAAIDELLEMEINPEKYKRYASFGSLMREVLSDA